MIVNSNNYKNTKTNNNTNTNELNLKFSGLSGPQLLLAFQALTSGCVPTPLSAAWRIYDSCMDDAVPFRYVQTCKHEDKPILGVG